MPLLLLLLLLLHQEKRERRVVIVVVVGIADISSSSRIVDTHKRDETRAGEGRGPFLLLLLLSTVFNVMMIKWNMEGRSR